MLIGPNPVQQPAVQKLVHTARFVLKYPRTEELPHWLQNNFLTKNFQSIKREFEYVFNQWANLEIAHLMCDVYVITSPHQVSVK